MSEEVRNDAATGAETGEQQVNSLFAQRLAKVRELEAAGIDPYGHAFPNTVPIEQVRAEFVVPAEGEYGPEVIVAGRLTARRGMGKSIFADLRDSSGKIQLFVGKSEIGDEAFALFKKLDIGDIVGIKGPTFLTRMGELTIRVHECTLLSKSLRPLPEKFHGLVDVEQRYRQRYLDLIMNEESRSRFVKRSKIIACIRNYMLANRFMEVETPMLHPIPGGANAKPFITHHNALDMDMYLRIAPELYLKRLVVGGFERVFELNRNFRNEGLSIRHNPEFTMMEFYATYWTYKDQMDFTEAILRHVAQEVNGSTMVHYQGHDIDLGKPFDRLTPRQAIQKYAPQYTDEKLADEAFLRSELKRLGAPQPDYVGIGALEMALFEEVAESKLIDPTFIVDYPVEISPLARASDTNPELTERFELYIAGRETANGFSELNDPEDQAARFKAQADAKAHGDDEAMYYDADYIRALEFGLPPTGGCGIGIDRFVMLLTDAASIRDVLLFPHMRPEA